MLRRAPILPLLFVLACAAEEADPVDRDGDGFSADVDCDDGDPFVYPGALEHCNGRDDDCDGAIDAPDPSATTLWYVDADGDGFGDPDTAVRSCEAPEGLVPRGEDCDDADPGVRPGATDVCDGVDNDCDRDVDENPDQQGWLDADGDGFGGSLWSSGCLGQDVTVESLDCDDDDETISPVADERCNGVDDDCDGLADDLDPDGPVDPRPFYVDVDLDGFGDGEHVVLACDPPSGNVSEVPGDCDDRDDATFPGAFEGCEPVDRDCDGLLPDDTAWWRASWPTRIPLTVTAPVDRHEPVLSVTVDVGAAVPGVDPRAVALVVQDCSVGAVRLDAELTDGLGGVFDGAATLPLGDGVGGLHAVLDRDLVGGESVSLALYVGGSISSVPGDAFAEEGALGSGVVTASFDEVDGGLLELSVDDLASVPQGLVASAPDRGTAGFGSPLGFVDYGFATFGDPVGLGIVASLDVTTPFEDPELQVEQRVRWVAFSGRPEVYGWVTVALLADGDVEVSQPLALLPGALRDDAVATVHPEGFASWSSPDGHVAAGWVLGPDQAGLEASDTVTLTGSEAALPASLTAGEHLVAERLLVVRGGEGPVDDALPEVVQALDPFLDVVQGPVETY